MLVTIEVDNDSLGISDDQTPMLVLKSVQLGISYQLNLNAYKDGSLDFETRRARSRANHLAVKAAVRLP